jgi:glycosyltransferase involved in cell wall biosynthesis
MDQIKKNIIIICSWVDSNGLKGIFFREQAKLVSDEFNVTLVRVDVLGLRKFIKSFLALKSISRVITDNELPLIIYFSLETKHFPRFINDYFKKLIYNKMNREFDFANSKNILIHAQSIFDAGFWAYALHTKFGTPYIVTEHNLFILNDVSQRKKESINNIIQNAKRFLVVSHDKARQILNYGFDFQFNVIGNYVNESIFYPSDSNHDSIFRIITIGAYTFIKDPQTIFDMLKLIDKESYLKHIEFVYVGFDGWGGNNLKTIEGKIKELDIKKITIKLIPIATRIEIAEILRSSDLFVFSSISEGMPVSIMEALATGLPVCTTQCGGVDELIRDFNGKIVPLRDHHSMFEFVDSCIRGKLLFDKGKISKYLVSEYGNDAFKNKLIKYYN